eukprot:SAG31_NODE_897_length_11148_cov_15.102815_16_plen_215_part_00
MRLRSEAVQGTARALRSLGFDVAGDLQLLLPRGPEQTELMEELRARGVSVADRGKIRLLLAGEVRAAGPAMIRLSPGAAAESAGEAQQSPLRSSTRQLQETTGAGVSADALAIVFSVLVGAAGYLVQVRRKHGVAVIVARSQLGALVRHARVGILSSAGGALCGGTGAGAAHQRSQTPARARAGKRAAGLDCSALDASMHLRIDFCFYPDDRPD